MRDFYRWLQQQGLLADSRFAELPYRLRHHVAEGICLPVALDPDDPDGERLFDLPTKNLAHPYLGEAGD